MPLSHFLPLSLPSLPSSSSRINNDEEEAPGQKTGNAVADADIFGPEKTLSLPPSVSTLPR